MQVLAKIPATSNLTIKKFSSRRARNQAAHRKLPPRNTIARNRIPCFLHYNAGFHELLHLIGFYMANQFEFQAGEEVTQVEHRKSPRQPFCLWSEGGKVRSSGTPACVLVLLFLPALPALLALRAHPAIQYLPCECVNTNGAHVVLQ